MLDFITVILALIIFFNVVLAASSRLLHCIKTIAAQGVLVGLLPLCQALAEGAGFEVHATVMSAVNIIAKGVLLPMLLAAAMRKAAVERELEPFVGYSASVLLVFALIAASFGAAARMEMDAPMLSKLAVPAALATMFSGLFLIVSRRKAITQVIGFLAFENGISVFGASMMLQYGLLVELGILLDVFVLVFIAGIVIFHISREFSHIDADKLGAEAEPSEPHNT